MSDVVMEETRFGFIYGAAHVERICNYQGSVSIWIGSEAVTTQGTGGIEVWVSPQGRSIRVFRNGNELVERTDA